MAQKNSCKIIKKVIVVKVIKVVSIIANIDVKKKKKKTYSTIDCHPALWFVNNPVKF